MKKLLLALACAGFVAVTGSSHAAASEVAARAFIDARDSSFTFDGITAKLMASLTMIEIDNQPVDSFGNIFFTCASGHKHIDIVFPDLADVAGVSEGSDIKGTLTPYGRGGMQYYPVAEFTATGFGEDLAMLIYVNDSISAALKSVYDGEDIWFRYAGDGDTPPLHISILSLANDREFKANAATAIRACDLL